MAGGTGDPSGPLNLTQEVKEYLESLDANTRKKLQEIRDELTNRGATTEMKAQIV